MVASPLHKFLAERGYKEHPVPDREHQRGFTKTFPLHKGKRFVAILEYSYYDSPEYSYTISSRFELPDGRFAKIDFHTFGGSELVERLEHYEDQAREVFLLLKGLGQE